MNWTLYKNGVAEDITQYVQLSPTDKEFQDASLDSGSAEIGPITNSEALKPEQCRIEYSDGGSSWWFRLVSDSVKMAQRGAIPSYVHSIQFVSLSRDLAFHCVKGMDFRQPKDAGNVKIKISEWWASGFRASAGSDPEFVAAKCDFIKLNRKLKVASGVAYTRVIRCDASLGVLTWSVVDDYSASFHSNVRYVQDAEGPSGANPLELFFINASGTGEIALTNAQVSALNSAIANGKYIGMSEEEGTPATTSDYFADSKPLIVSCELRLKTYYYTYYDVISGILKGIGRPSDATFGADSYFSMPSGGAFYDFISSTPSPDFQFGQGASAWDCLCEVYRAFDALPTVDQNGVLGVKYFNERKSATPISVSNGDVLDSSYQISDDSRANGLVARYQNGVTDHTEVYPSWSSSGVGPRPITLGVPSLTDFYLSPMKPVQSVTSLSILGVTIGLTTNLGSTEQHISLVMNCAVDASDYVFEKSLWSVLPKSTEATRSPNQLNSSWYESGSSNGIYFGAMGYDLTIAKYSYQQMATSAVLRMFSIETATGKYPTTGTNYTLTISPTGSLADKLWNMRYSMEYLPIIGGAMREEGPEDKKDGETFISQQAGVLSLPRMGASMLGTASQLGEPSRKIVYGFDQLGNLPEAGSWYEDSEGALWIANASARAQMRPLWRPELSFAKNFNQLAKRIQVDRRVAFTAIEPSIALLSETIYQEYVYLTLMPPSASLPSAVHFDVAMLGTCFLSALDPQRDPTENRVDFGVYRGGVSYTIGSTMYTEWIGYQYMPITSYSGGNCVCLEGGFDSPISAGNQLTVVSGWFSDSLSSDAVLYSDQQGFSDVADVFLCQSGAVSDFSSIPSVAEPSAALSPAKFYSLAVAKRPNDVLRFNFEIIFLPYLQSGAKRVMTYPALFAECSQVSRAAPSRIRLFLLSSSDVPYSPFESQAYGTEAAQTSGIRFTEESRTATNGYCWKLSLVASSGPAWASSQSWSGWMIADANGSPLIASNQPIASGSGISFYAFSSHNRL